MTAEWTDAERVAYETGRQAMYARADAREAASKEADTAYLVERARRWADALASRAGIYSPNASADNDGAETEGDTECTTD